MTTRPYIQKPARLPSIDGFVLGYANPKNQGSQTITPSSQIVAIPPSRSALLTGPTGSGKSILIQQNINRPSQRPRILYERIPSDTAFTPVTPSPHSPWKTVIFDGDSLKDQTITAILRHLLTFSSITDLHSRATAFATNMTDAGHATHQWLHQIIENSAQDLTPQQSSFIICEPEITPRNHRDSLSRHRLSDGLALTLFLAPTTSLHEGQIILDDPDLLSPFARQEIQFIETHTTIHKATLIVAAIDTYFIPNVLINSQDAARITLTRSPDATDRACSYGRVTDHKDGHPQTFWFPLTHHPESGNDDNVENERPTAPHNLSSARDQAKTILRNCRIDNPDTKLAHAYEALARENGYKNWATMKAKLTRTS